MATIEKKRIRQRTITYQAKLEELRKAFAEENNKNEEAYNNLMTKNFALYNPAIYFIKTEKKFRNACRNLYGFILYARAMNASPDDIFLIKSNKLYIDESN
jgi:hypothetical protein